MIKFKTELKWALIFMGVTLAWMLLERLTGLHSTHIDKHATYTNFFAIVAIAVYVVALRDKRATDFNGSMTYKEGFISGVVISVIVGVLTPIGQLITAYVISPNYFENAIAYGVANDLTTQADAEAYFSLKNYIIQSTIFAPVVGVLTSAVVAFFVKSKPEVIAD
ncbi:MAG: DUF4199 domain-containing protein [Candidatus Marinimicrobia bacterium]|jgi:hypothetical protein|nr:DUF4199 domain-containing protein [Candidatus Neomarinimicrobiota bacterium]MBT3632216.1 DUF4199 domain-containing protein [Candidatus Neomarinimicrobiota bacterium]MBT3824371.1 DUF4199 domain-containing protein [Candidatus Neomarinimicrobiota bacterium]MBT4130084.1 DUF4199 domain-containing protein [Candidatus Neomarinimicrobiota bacterium]MBT4295071.1 DUF4199 domain-containing protein [Candidatus Neomarinimicrobiota bacterium]